MLSVIVGPFISGNQSLLYRFGYPSPKWKHYNSSVSEGLFFCAVMTWMVGRSDGGGLAAAIPFYDSALSVICLCLPPSYFHFW